MSEVMQDQYECPMCGYRFLKEEAKKTCQGCPLAAGCHMIKCPNCNYELAVKPELKNLLPWRRKR